MFALYTISRHFISPKLISAGRESRTLTIFQSTDFKSGASASSAIPARLPIDVIALPTGYRGATWSVACPEGHRALIVVEQD